MILAGGQGSRLGALTKNVAKPAVPFGGKYRIIDFPLSNCVHSGIDTVGVLTQYQPLDLNTYIGNGNPWDLNRNHGGVYVLPPYQSAKAGEWYKGTANAIYQNLGFLDRFNPGTVLILSGDHIYKMHYGKMLETHLNSNAAVTIAVMPVPWEEASRFGIMNVDGDGNIIEFEEKPKNPKSNLASMGIYIFNYSVLKKYLTDRKTVHLRAAYVRTAKNSPVSELFDRLGFSVTAEEGGSPAVQKEYAADTASLPDTTGLYKYIS